MIKKFCVALLSAFFGTLILDILIHAVFLHDVYAASAKYWLPAEQLNRMVPLGWASLLLSQAAFGALYVRLGLRGIRKGLEFGAWIALAKSVGAFGLASLVPWPAAILVGMAAQQVVNGLLIGLCFGKFYTPAS